jgi:hypothetical protein
VIVDPDRTELERTAPTHGSPDVFGPDAGGQVMVDIDETEMMADYDQLITYRLLEGRLLYRLIDEDRQRAIVSAELGDAIGIEDAAEFCVVDATEFLPSALAHWAAETSSQ